MSSTSPQEILLEVVRALPASCRPNIVIIGSLAVGFHYFGNDSSAVVRTKDVDCIIEPYAISATTGERILRALLDAGWIRKRTGTYCTPGNSRTPDAELPAVRLYPPGIDSESEGAWFLELLTVPEMRDGSWMPWTRIIVDEGHFGLPAFRFLPAAVYGPIHSENLGIRYARPEMMALANLLEHPRIRPETMTSLIAGRSIKRSNKDLGRVLAIIMLADLSDYRAWGRSWRQAIEHCFPDELEQLARSAGYGLQALLSSSNDLDEALYTCNNGLLASQPATQAMLRAAGARLMDEAIHELKQSVAPKR